MSSFVAMTDTDGAGHESPRDWYSWLIAPLTIAEFEREYYERRPCRVLRDPSPYYQSLLSEADLDTVLGTHATSYPDISLVQGDTDVAAAEYTNEAGRIQPLEVARRFDQGATIVFRQLHRRVATLAGLSVALGQRFACRVQTNVYLTPADAQGFAPHWDTHDVFVLQIRGSKRWTTYDTPVTLPLRGERFAPGNSPPGPITDEFTLGPGSAVYLPRGVMHSARSTDEPSLHITVGLTAFTWADFLIEGVAAAALDDESLRRNLPGAFARDSFPPDERRRLFREKLAVVQARFDPDVVWRHFQDEVLAANVPLFTDVVGSRLRPDGVTADTQVARRPDMLIEQASDDDSCVLRFCGQELRLPAVVAPAVRFATTTDRFAVRDLPDDLDGKEKIVLVRRLLREGLLTRT